MAACYAPNAHFIDPVFELQGAEIGAMWTMLCERGSDLRVESRDVAPTATAVARTGRRGTRSR